MSGTADPDQPRAELQLADAAGFWAVHNGAQVYYLNALARRLYRAPRQGTDPGAGIGRWVQLASVRRLPDGPEWVVTVGSEHVWRLDEAGWARHQEWTTPPVTALEPLSAQDLRDRVGTAAAVDTVDLRDLGTWGLRTPEGVVYVDTRRWLALRLPTLDGAPLPHDGQWAVLVGVRASTEAEVQTLTVGRSYTVLATVNGGSTPLAWALNPLLAIEPEEVYPR